MLYIWITFLEAAFLATSFQRDNFRRARLSWLNHLFVVWHVDTFSAEQELCFSSLSLPSFFRLKKYFYSIEFRSVPYLTFNYFPVHLGSLYGDQSTEKSLREPLLNMLELFTCTLMLPASFIMIIVRTNVHVVSQITSGP